MLIAKDDRNQTVWPAPNGLRVFQKLSAGDRNIKNYLLIMKDQDDTISIALAELARQGYTKDYNLNENLLIGGDNQADLSTVTINELYHYETTSVPGEEVYIFALATITGEKGVFVYGRQIVDSPQATLIFAELLLAAEKLRRTE